MKRIIVARLPEKLRTLVRRAWVNRWPKTKLSEGAPTSEALLKHGFTWEEMSKIQLGYTVPNDPPPKLKQVLLYEPAEVLEALGTRRDGVWAILNQEVMFPEAASNQKGFAFEIRAATLLDPFFYRATKRHIRARSFWEWMIIGFPDGYETGDLVFKNGEPLPFPVECKHQKKIMLSRRKSWQPLIPKGGVLVFCEPLGIFAVSYKVPKILKALPWVLHEDLRKVQVSLFPGDAAQKRLEPVWKAKL